SRFSSLSPLPPAAQQSTLASTRDTDKQVRRQAFSLLSWYLRGSSAAARRLVDALEDPDPNIRGNARYDLPQQIRRLTEKERSGLMTKVVLPTLLRVLDSKDPERIEMAAFLLCELAPEIPPSRHAALVKRLRSVWPRGHTTATSEGKRAVVV